MNRKPCPEPEILSRYQDRELSPDEESRWKPHLEVCPDCHARMEMWEGLYDPQQAADADERPDGVTAEVIDDARNLARDGNRSTVLSPSPLGSYLHRGIGWAAGLLLAAGVCWGAVVWIAMQTEEAHRGNGPDPFPQSGGEHKTSTLADGVRVEWTDAVRWRLSEGDRISLDRGILHITVPKGAPGVTVETPAGTVRDIGTVFTVGTLRYRPSGGGDPRALMFVQVWEGSVEIEADGVRKTIPAGAWGYRVEGEEPFLQDSREAGRVTPRVVVRQLADAHGGSGERVRFLEALFLTGGLRDPNGWKRLENGELSEREKEVLEWGRRQIEPLGKPPESGKEGM